MRRLYVTLQYLLPHHLVSRLVGSLAQSRWTPLKRILIRAFIHIYEVDMSQAQTQDPERYASFTEFFVRQLKSDLRPMDSDVTTLICPADGTLSHIGKIEAGVLMQAKGMAYTLQELLGDGALAEPYAQGAYVTIYLAPRDYHRVHAPIDGKLVALRHIPGRLFAVNPTTTARIPRLFARNERVVMSFETPIGPLAVVLVGAMIVGSIYTSWTGIVTEDREIGRVLERGEELAQFRMGSTVIVCLPCEVARWEADLVAGRRVRFGERLATIVS
ncbi:MAG: archaetidylserine decarboxylase [Pseudomonadales bacterium]